MKIQIFPAIDHKPSLIGFVVFSSIVLFSLAQSVMAMVITTDNGGKVILLVFINKVDNSLKSTGTIIPPKTTLKVLVINHKSSLVNWFPTAGTPYHLYFHPYQVHWNENSNISSNPPETIIDWLCNFSSIVLFSLARSVLTMVITTNNGGKVILLGFLNIMGNSLKSTGIMIPPKNNISTSVSSL
jgi:hypothetical protein